MTITEFLLARIAEDEAVARSVAPDDWGYDVAANVEVWADGDRISSGVGRVLAECEAKRKIVERIAPYIGNEPPPQPWGDPEAADELGWPILLALAAVYADHPDYDQAWTPAD